jgi:predicted dehydrogenase
LLDTAVHTLDLVMDLLNWPTVIRASGVTFRHRVSQPGYRNHPAYGELSAESMDVEDLALGMLRLQNGLTITLEVSWAGLTPEDEDYAQVLVGDRSGARIRPFGPGPLLETFHSVQGRSVDVAYDIPELADVYGPQMEHWVRCLRGWEKPLVRPDQAVIVLSIIDALYKSAELGREVSLQDVCLPAGPWS